MARPKKQQTENKEPLKQEVINDAPVDESSMQESIDSTSGPTPEQSVNHDSIIKDATLPENVFEYGGDYFQVKAPLFMLGNKRYERAEVLNSKKLQEELTKTIFYHKGKKRNLFVVKSSVLGLYIP